MSDSNDRLAREDVVHVRLLEALREVGELFIAFGPLEVVINKDPMADGALAILFVAIGSAFLAYALVVERRDAKPRRQE